MQTNRRGFILYIVVTVLLALSILAFALNSLKSGAVTQLARNVDQNRLSLLAQSANAEVIAMIRSNANYAPDSQIFKKLRSMFPTAASPAPAVGTAITLFSNFEPQQTLKIADSAGYRLVIKSRATLTPYREAPAKSVMAFNAYLDVYSQAYRRGAEENVIEVHERRDVRLVDLRHRFDRYAVFVKNFGPSYNHPHRRITIQGIPADGPHVSHAYFGYQNYPACNDSRKHIWMDLCYEPGKKESQNFPNFNKITGFSGAAAFTGAAMPNCLFEKQSYEFKELKGITEDQFFQVKAVIKLYEIFVNQAADGCLGNTTPSSKTRNDLKNLCRQAMNAVNSNAAAWDVCNDFYSNFRMVGNKPDYSKCNGFIQVLRTCIKNWKYVYGFTDANSIWKLESLNLPNLPPTRTWATSLALGGLASPSQDLLNKGSYFYEYLQESGGKPYNPERVRVGKMPRLFGDDGKQKLFVEGPVFLRFFKVGFLDTFSQPMEFFRGTKIVEPEPVPLRFTRYDKEIAPGKKTFLNTPLTDAVPSGGVVPEHYLMSRAIDNISVNALQGDSLAIFDGNGNNVTTSTVRIGVPSTVEPLQPDGSNIKATTFGRLIDFKTVSWNYPNTADFVQHRVASREGKKTLYLDGCIYIEEGDLDLSDVNQYYGKGMIYIGRGNCFLSNLKRIGNRKDTLRIYLRAGKYVIREEFNAVEIQASLAAFYYPFGSSDPTQMGALILNGQSSVKILGNLLVDYLYTHDSDNDGLADGGQLIIEHDPLIYDPAGTAPDGEELDPYHVSIGPVRTLFSINSGGKTF